MMRLYPTALLSLFVLFLFGCQGNKQNPRELKTQVDSVSYIIGIDVGRNLKAQKYELKPEVIAEGIRDAMADSAKPMIKEEDARGVFENYQKELTTKRSEKNKKEGMAFLEANRKKSDVVTLPDGLQYRILSAGSGPKPKLQDSVRVHFRVMSITREEISSSYARGGPARWRVSSMFPGIAEALQLMPAGSKWEVFIPPSLGLGEQGGPPGSGVEGNLTLIFEIELLAVK